MFRSWRTTSSICSGPNHGTHHFVSRRLAVSGQPGLVSITVSLGWTPPAMAASLGSGLERMLSTTNCLAKPNNSVEPTRKETRAAHAERSASIRDSLTLLETS
jgi:hypothetical protein